MKQGTETPILKIGSPSFQLPSLPPFDRNKYWLRVYLMPKLVLPSKSTNLNWMGKGSHRVL